VWSGAQCGVGFEAVVVTGGRSVHVEQACRRRRPCVPHAGVVENAGGNEGGLRELEASGFVARSELDSVESSSERFEELVRAGLSEGGGWAGGEERVAARRNSRDQRGGRYGWSEAR